jgi:hypothetical protein
MRSADDETRKWLATLGSIKYAEAPQNSVLPMK